MKAVQETAPGSAGGSPFSPRMVLGLLVFGALFFLATLFLMSRGEGGDPNQQAVGHGASTGLNGYAGLARLLEADGYNVSLSRTAGQQEEATLLILTPPTNADAEDVRSAIDAHREWGPTIVILPKWNAARLDPVLYPEANDGWVSLGLPEAPEWAEVIGRHEMIAVALERNSTAPGEWSGLGLIGSLPEPKVVQTLSGNGMAALVVDTNQRQLVSFWDDGGYYPWLWEASALEPMDEDEADSSRWPLVVVAEPDLVNNYGMADKTRADLALAIIETVQEGQDMPVVFDLTLNGLGSSANLLTLAFTPPFLAATLCFLIAALVIGWRAFRRFGPPLAEVPIFAFGKRQLAVNVAALIQRSKRFHLLGAPYAAIERAKVTEMLGLRPTANVELAEAEIDRLLALRGMAQISFSENAQALRQAKRPHELLRRAHALKQIERKLAR